MIFNIYYINFPKVYEIKMMLSNVISLNREKQIDKTEIEDTDVKASLGISFLNIFNTNLDGNRKSSNSSSQKVLETFEVKTTKSIILNEIIDKSETVFNFSNTKEGQLIKIDNVTLSLDNEPELRTVKLALSGSFRGLDLNIPDLKGVDTNDLFNSMFKDYAYKIVGNTLKKELLVIKIPVTFENEFESSYSIDDLFIGKVSVIGLYKGKIKMNSLKNSFKFFQEVGFAQNNFKSKIEENTEIENSQYDQETVMNNLNTDKYQYEELHYIDLLAIIQNVSISSNTLKSNE